MTFMLTAFATLLGVLFALVFFTFGCTKAEEQGLSVTRWFAEIFGLLMAMVLVPVASWYVFWFLMALLVVKR